jgi:[histone H3]-lysine9 N-trimethyltransferase SUV39H
VPVGPDEKKNCHWCQIRAFETQSEYPITIVNEVDNATLPHDFRFIESVVLGRGVTAAEDSFRFGCECDDDEDCQYMGCLCLEEHVIEDETLRVDEEGRVKAYAYHTHGAKEGLLKGKQLPSRMPIYECHSACSCSEQCKNRVVDSGRKLPLQIFRTEKTGWGEFVD